MSEIKVNKITPRTACGTTTLGDSGDTFTIPSGATITNAGTASGFGATGETSWDTTVKTTGTFTATAGVGYFLNTTGGIITVNLPVGAAGSSVALADYAGTWQTNAVTVNANGTEKIGGVASTPVTLNTEGQSVTFVYVDSTQGWVNVLDSTSNVRGSAYVAATGGCITYSGNYKMHTFLAPGTFCVSSAGGGGSSTVDYLIVAGGGGGATCVGGAGGAGGFRESPGTASGCYPVSPSGASPAAAITTPVGPYAIVTGGGGAGGTCVTGIAGQGNLSSALGLTSAGGGAGGNGTGSSTPAACGGSIGQPGGSGGGGGFRSGQPGGAGNDPVVSPVQGFAGGSSTPSTTPTTIDAGGGGGGASTVGANGVNNQGGTGGTGQTTGITAASVAYAGGGGGATCNGPASPRSPCGTGGSGWGPGAGSGTAGTINRGGGGGGGIGGGANVGGNGGSGIVVIRYQYQ